MAGISENNHREAGQSPDGTSPVNDLNLAAIVNRVAFDKMPHNQNGKISDRDEGYDARVL